MNKPNSDIRQMIRRKGLYTWQVAKAYGVTDTYFFNILRRDLSGAIKTKIISIIDRLEKDQQVS